MSRPRVLLADDHGIIVDGLCRILESRFDVVGVVHDGRALVQEALRLRPDLILADISMPVLNGIDAVRQIRKQDVTMKVIFLTMHPDLHYATEAIEAGASGYVLKHSVTSDLLTAVERVLAGERYLSPKLAPRIEEALAEIGSGRKRSLSVDLTERQREVLQLIAEGRSAKEIADILSISPRTAEFHKRQLRKQLGVATTAELVQQALRLRLLDSKL